MSGAELRENIVLENRNPTTSCFSACLRGLCGRARAPGCLKDWLDSGAVAFAPGLCGRLEMRSALARYNNYSQMGALRYSTIKILCHATVHTVLTLNFQ
eukprot:4554995-Prymnesium_polylepis.1